MTKEELKTYNDALIEHLMPCIKISSDNTDQLKEISKCWKEQKATVSIHPNLDDYFKIEDLKEWLYAVARNNEDQADCIINIVDRIPGFIQYTKDKKEGII